MDTEGFYKIDKGIGTMKNIEDVIERVTEMEALFDEIQESMASGTDDSLKEKIHQLIRYYESEQWMEDYARDERGEFPADLKRGVLSEDGIYNLLSEIDE